MPGGIIEFVLIQQYLYIGAIRDPAKEAALDAFLEGNAPVTFMSAVVMQELRAGAVTDASARALDRGIFAVFERGVAVTEFNLTDVNQAVLHAAANGGPFSLTVLRPGI